MMGRVAVGLDVGHHAVRGVRVSQGLGRLRVLDTFEASVEQGPDVNPFDWPTAGQILAIESLLRMGKLRRTDSISISLPTHMVSARRVTLPFRHSEALRQALPYEMEGHLPFDIQDVVIAYQPLRATSDATASLWVSACPKTVLQRCLERFQQVGIDPMRMGVDAFGLSTLYHRFSKQTSRMDTEVLMIDVGASKTVLCDIHRDIQWTRSFPMGGDAMGGMPNGVEVADPIRNAIGPWMLEIEKSLRSAQSGRSRSYCLVGGGSALKKVEEVLTVTLGMRPWRLDLPVAPRFAPGLGAVLNGPSINFRQGEWAHGGAAGNSPRGRWAEVGLALCLLLGLAVSDFAIYAYQKEAHYQERKTGLRRTFLELFPRAQNVPDEVEYARARVAELSRNIEALAVEERGPLWVLNEIAAGVSMPMEVQEMTIEEGSVRIEAQTDSYLSLDKIRDGLIKRAFQEVKISDAKVTADQSKVRFRIQISLQNRGKSPS